MPKQIRECKECERGNILGNAPRRQETGKSEDVHLFFYCKIYDDGYKDVYGILVKSKHLGCLMM